MEVSLVSPEHLDLCWGECAPHLERAIGSAHGRYELSDMKKEIEEFEQHLWVVFNDEGRIISALTTRFMTYPRFNMLSVQFAGGDEFFLWRDKMQDILERFAKDCNCAGLEMAGRVGFKKALASCGWTPEFTVYQKMLGASDV